MFTMLKCWVTEDIKHHHCSSSDNVKTSRDEHAHTYTHDKIPYCFHQQNFTHKTLINQRQSMCYTMTLDRRPCGCELLNYTAMHAPLYMHIFIHLCITHIFMHLHIYTNIRIQLLAYILLSSLLILYSLPPPQQQHTKHFTQSFYPENSNTIGFHLEPMMQSLHLLEIAAKSPSTHTLLA